MPVRAASTAVIRALGRSGARTIRQVAALPYRIDGEGPQARLRILLVTSRQTRRWVLPKGNVPEGVSDADAAAMEAREEAGVAGIITPKPLGRFRYRKWRSRGGFRLAKVAVYPLCVTEEMDDWMEKTQRERRWFSASGAADVIDERELRAIIRAFRPDALALARSLPGPPEPSRLGGWWQRIFG